MNRAETAANCRPYFEPAFQRNGRRTCAGGSLYRAHAMNPKRGKLQKLARLYSANLRKYRPARAGGRLGGPMNSGARPLRTGSGDFGHGANKLERAKNYWRRTFRGKKPQAHLKSGGNFFMQTLSPFEATHRGFRETNAELLKRNRDWTPKSPNASASRSRCTPVKPGYARSWTTAPQSFF